MNVPPFITHITVTISPETLFDNLVTVNFDVSPISVDCFCDPSLKCFYQFFNPLPVDLVVQFVQADASVDGTIYSHFNQAFENFVIPAGKTVNSGEFGNVVLTQGALGSLGIIPLGYLDVAAAATALYVYIDFLPSSLLIRHFEGWVLGVIKYPGSKSLKKECRRVITLA
jgi:hypothetical protein